MEKKAHEGPEGWGQETARTFIDLGRYFVPERQNQIQIICDLIPPRTNHFHILELCCGEGLLATAILDRFPDCIVHGYDGSEEMLQHAAQHLAKYGDRFQTRLFDLASREWRTLPWPLHAVVSSLAIHHLDGPQKQQLFQDVYQMLSASGVFLIADLIEPANLLGVGVAARAWDQAVRRRALEIDGDTAAFDYFRQEQWNMYTYPDPTDKPSALFAQLNWLQAAGFDEIDVYWMKAGHAIFGGRKP